MEILICQTCGLLLRGEAKSCLSCGTPASKFSATALPVMANTSAPLAVAVDPDPLVLERVVTSRRLGTYKLKESYFGNGHNGENGHGENGNGDNGHNGGNGHNGENGGTVSANPGSSQTGLAALSLGFMGGRKPAPGPLFADNPWGESETPMPDPASTAPATNIDQSAPGNQFDPAAAASSQPVPDPFVSGFPPPQPLSLSQDPAAEPQGTEIGQAEGTQGTSPWDKPAPQSPFGSLDPFSSGAQAAQNMFMGVPSAPAEIQSSVSADSTVSEPAPQVMPAAETDRPMDPFSFDSQAPAQTPNLVTGSFFDDPAPPVKSEMEPESFAPDSGSAYALTPAATEEGFEPATPVYAEPVDTEFSATVENTVEQSPASNSEDIGAAADSTAQAPESEKAPDNTFVQTAAIAAAAAIAGAAAGAAVTNALNAKSSPVGGGDFFDVGVNTMRPGATPGGDTDEEAPFDPFSPAASKPDPVSSAAGPPDDFFSAAPIGRPKRDDGVVEEVKETAQAAMDAFNFDSGTKVRGDEDAFPDESKMRGKKEDAGKSALESESEARPKIARPRGFSPTKEKDSEITLKEKSDKSDKSDESTDDFFTGKKGKKESSADDDDDDTEKESPPPRKSFSGGSASTIKRPGSKKKEVVKEKAKPKGKNKDEDADSDDTDDDENLPFFEREISLGGMTVTNKSAAILGTICVFMTIVVFNTFCTFCTYLAGSMPKGGGQGSGILGGIGQQKSVDISGIYNVYYVTPMEKNGNSWKMQLGQQGNNIFGRGEDGGGPWILQGSLVAPNGIQFKKFYLRDGKPFGKGITYQGQVGVTELGRPYMQGALAYETKMGKFWRATIAQVTGKWKATQTVSGAVLASSGVAQPAPPSMQAGSPLAPPGGGNVLSMLQPSDTIHKGDMSGFFLKIAFGLIGVGVLLALAALFIFGPSGKLNIMKKQEYIPSQYKSQHNKMMAEWSRPIKKGSVPLGTRVEWRFWKPWVPRVMAIPPESRTNNPHMIVIGGSDKGKSSLLANMICHDIESGDRAVIVIDSDGELIDLVTNWTAANVKGKELAKRVVIIDPTYRGGSMSYNPLEPLESVNFIDAASAIVHGFKAIYTEPPGSQSQWNQQTANILRNAAILLMANNKTLIDLPTLLQDNDFRDILLEGIEKKKKERTEYTTLIETWGQYKRLARTDQWINWVEPILNRVTPMLSDPRIRPILTKPVGDLRLQDLIINKQVLLVRIPQGQLDQNANLLGSLLVTGLKQAALSLSIHEADKQKPCALYLDEMNNFIEKETIEALTQETDKFKIGFVGCCKTLQHLPEDFRNQIIINVGTVCAFALAKKDGDMIGPQMFRVDGRKIKHQTIGNFFNQINTSPQFELISDEEKLNIDRVVGQETRTFFCYRVGTVAGTFSLKTHDFPDPPKAKVKAKLIEQMHTGAPVTGSSKKSAAD